MNIPSKKALAAKFGRGEDWSREEILYLLHEIRDDITNSDRPAERFAEAGLSSAISLYQADEADDEMAIAMLDALFSGLVGFFIYDDELDSEVRQILGEFPEFMEKSPHSGTYSWNFDHIREAFLNN
jgi:hypothetical protein